MNLASLSLNYVVLLLLASFLGLFGCGQGPGDSSKAAATGSRSSVPEVSTDEKAKLDERLDALRKAGVPVIPEELDAWYATPPADENAAARISAAFAKIVRPEPGQHLPGTQGGAELPAPSMPLSAELKTVIATHLARNKAALDLLYHAASNSVEKARYPVDLKLGVSATLPHLSDIGMCRRLLALDTLLCTENGRSDAAVQSLLATLAFGRTLDYEPFLISQLLRMSADGTAATSLERLLNRRPLTEPQVTKLIPSFRKADESTGLLRGIVGERCNLVSLFDAKPEVLMKLLAGMGGGADVKEPSKDEVTEFVKFYTPTKFADLKLGLDFFEAYAVALAVPFPKRLESMEQFDTMIEQARSQNLILSGIMLPVIGSRQLIKDAENVAKLRLARFALIIEQYRSANRFKIPQSLAELPSELQNDIPTDPFDGQPLRFKLVPKGYLVYSIGQNRKDDGGSALSLGMVSKEGKKAGPEDITFTVLR